MSLADYILIGCLEHPVLRREAVKAILDGGLWRLRPWIDMTAKLHVPDNIYTDPIVRQCRARDALFLDEQWNTTGDQTKD